MSRILSQEEVSALLKEASASTEDEPSRRPSSKARAAPTSWKAFDFRRPERMPRDKLRAVQYLHDRFCQNLAIALSAYLRTAVEARLDKVEQVGSRPFVAHLADPTALYVLKTSAGGPVVIEVDSALAFACIDRSLGGPGGAPQLRRALTEIELHVLEELVMVLAKELREAWRQARDVDMSVAARETRPGLLSMGPANEVLVNLRLELQIGSPNDNTEVVGVIQIAVSLPVVEALCAALQRDEGDTRRQVTTPDVARRLSALLGRVPVGMEARLKSRGITARDLSRVGPGHILDLGRPAAHPVDLRIGETLDLEGALVLAGERCAVELSGRSRTVL